MEKVKFIESLENICIKIQEKRLYLNNLDNYINDGDHGNNLAYGFNEALNFLKSIKTKKNFSTKAIIKEIGNILLNKIGSISGVLYGNIFKKTSSNTNFTSFKKNNFISFLLTGTKVIKSLTSANVGDKTMLDIWQPLLNYLKKEKEPWNKNKINTQLDKFLNETKKMSGNKTYKKSSIGYIDPGAASSTIIIKSILNNLFFANYPH